MVSSLLFTPRGRGAPDEEDPVSCKDGIEDLEPADACDVTQYDESAGSFGREPFACARHVLLPSESGCRDASIRIGSRICRPTAGAH